MRLGAQRVGQALHLGPAREAGQLGGVPQGRHVADLASPHLDRAPAGDQHPLTGQQDLVLIVQASRQEPLQPAGGQDLRHPPADAVGGQAEEPARLVVGERDGAVPVGGDGPFVDALQ